MATNRRLPDGAAQTDKRRKRKVAGGGIAPPRDRPRRLKPHAAKPDTYVSWRFDLADIAGEWPCSGIEQEKVYELVGKIREFESMTTHELMGPRIGCKAIPIANISPGARRRLEDLQLDDFPSIYEFHVSGKERIWAVRHGSIFHVVWWDPEHTVCPSKKKRT